MTEGKCKEIYQRTKKENPCFFCVQYDDGCQLKDHNCDSTSLRMYYEKSYQEIEPYLKDTYVKELEKELKAEKALNKELETEYVELLGKESFLENDLNNAKALIERIRTILCEYSCLDENTKHYIDNVIKGCTNNEIH